ncbi:hypothetical protein SAMN05421678_12848 [Actinopolymorpha cephalotaxi]|uniref:Uncharacterized protein n=1 Tax=Actinopolymorpha cephalotaxi TaxID=504797 RepID=A0A1I3C339_9ACTN|nr:DUF6221 family protein [Actinopolymorpha cephalotaxi]NYH84096.1 hypothetical protein [Actinopolymorpha cephalotaxi]SFH68736.1 hypothetical protein SAMN05421678_12848 [Actinopolymorpha cephalotaxi]
MSVDRFLLARIEEDKHLARKAYHLTMSQPELERILKTCAARRSIVLLYHEAIDEQSPFAHAYLIAVKTLTAIYNEHPDYKPDWAPPTPKRR